MLAAGAATVQRSWAQRCAHPENAAAPLVAASRTAAPDGLACCACWPCHMAPGSLAAWRTGLGAGAPGNRHALLHDPARTRSRFQRAARRARLSAAQRVGRCRSWTWTAGLRRPGLRHTPCAAAGRRTGLHGPAFPCDASHSRQTWFAVAVMVSYPALLSACLVSFCCVRCNLMQCNTGIAHPGSTTTM